MSVNYTTMFTRGTSSVFKSLTPVDGKIRFVVDTQELYIDYENQHIKISDIVRNYTYEQMVSLPESSILLDKVYFTSDTHQLYFYTPSSQTGEPGTWSNFVGAHTHHAADIVDLGPYATRQSLNKSDVGLNNVGNFLAVSTEANQGLTDTQKGNARSNIGAGSSDFSGDYNDLTNKPTLGTAAAKDVPQTGQDASSIQVVLGGDSRLSDARPASDVYSWAKAETKPTYTKSEIGLSNVGNFLAVSTEASQGLTDTQKSNARANIGAGTSSFSGDYNDLTNKPTIPPAVSVKGSAETEYRTGEVSISPANIGLNYVDNTSDATKKANFTGSIASGNTGFVTGGDAYTALGNKVNTSSVGAANGVASLDENGKLPTSQLPSIADDVLEYASKSDFPATGETGKIYVAKDTNLLYRYIGGSGTDKYTEVSPSIKLGETSETAYRGDRGKTAYDHSQSAHARSDATKVESSTNNGNIKINGVETTVYTHPSGTNPHGTTKADVGLGNVGNFLAVSTAANQGLSSEQQANARTNIGAGTSSFSGNYNDLTNKPTLGTAAAKNVATSGDASTSQVVMGNDSRLTDARPASDVSSWAKATTKPSYTKSEVGLGNVDNTSDATKKSNFTGSIAASNTGFVTGGDVYTALSGKLDTSLKGAANGLAELDGDGKVPAAQLPSYVDDVLEYDSQSAFPTTGEAGKIYVAKDTNKTYRWSGTAYVEISPSLALGETSSTAYRGDRGKAAYDHASDSSKLTTATSVGLYKVGSTAQGHISGLTAVAKSDITGLGIPAQDTTYSAGTGITFSGTTIKAKLKSDTASTLDSATISTTASRQYAVHPDKSGYLSVNVPWKNDNTTYSAGTGMVLSTTTFKTKLKNGDTASTLAAAATTTTASRQYAVEPDSSGYLSVNVPWQNTTYSSKAAASGGTEVSLVTTGEKYTWNNKTSNTGTVTNVATGVGLTGGSITTSGTIKAKLAQETNSTLASGTVTTTANRQYAVHPDSNGNLSVNVPWTDNNSGGTVTKVSTGVGLTGGDITTTGTIKAKLKQETASTLDSAAVTTTASRQYAVHPDKSGYLSVNVPWSNTTYSAGAGITLSSTTFKAKLKQESNSTLASATITTTADRQYAVHPDSNGQLSVNIPWQNTTYSSKAAASGGTEVSLVTTGEKYTWNNKTSNTGTVTSVATGAGLTGGTITTSGTIKCALAQETNSTLASAAITTTASRQYAVHPDSNGKLSVNVPWSNTTYSSKAAASGGTDVSLCTTGEKYTWNSKADSGHTHTLSIAADSGTSALTMAASTKYKLTAGGSTFIFTSTPNTTYSSKTAASGGTDVSLCTTGEKYTWNNKSNLTIGTTATTAAAGNHTHATSIATSSGTNQLTLAASTKYAITAGGTSYIFTTPPNSNTTYTFANGTNGFTVTPSGGSAQTVTVTPSIANNITGSGTKGYIAKFNGTNTVTNGPAFGSATTTYLRNDGNWATPTDTKNTAGSTDTSSKIFLIGATSQAANPQTYSDNEVYATSGVLTTKSVQVGGTAATMQYNSTNKCIDFVFA